MVTWGLILGLVYTLRSLFSVFFITFVLSYICRNVVRTLSSPFGGRGVARKIAVIVTYIVLLGAFYLGGRFLVPNIYEQGSQVYNLAVNLQLHEGLDKALAKLYASIRLKAYRNGEAYRKELEAYKRQADPETVFRNFKDYAQKLRRGFREHLVREFGEAAFEKFRESPQFDATYSAWEAAWIEKNEYEPRKEALEAAAEEELRQRYGEVGLRNLKERYGATPEDWSAYLKKDILDGIYAGIDTAKQLTLRNRFHEEFVKRKGEEAVRKLEGTPEWERRYKAYYENLPAAEREYPYELFVRLEEAGDAKAFYALLADREETDTQLERQFENEKLREFEEAFKGYEFVKEMNKRATQEFLPGFGRWVASAVEYTVTLAFHLILSVFLSFFIVWDIPRLRRMIGRLEHSRIANLYREVRPGLVSFGWLMGRAFQAQALIAAANTLLTLSALSLLQVPHRTFLCTLVFLCSFVPVVGVVISSIPISVVCLQLPGGFLLALEMIGCILIIHFIETTVLNPKIVGDMLKIHPLLVLVILLVGEHFFGVWGLLLGVPVSVYIFRFVILRDSAGLLPPDVAAVAMEGLAEGGAETGTASSAGMPSPPAGGKGKGTVDGGSPPSGR